MVSTTVAAAGVLAAWSPALAQDSGDIRVRVGLGAQLRPEFVGADHTEVGPLWDLDIARGTDEFAFEAPDYSFGIPVISSGGFSFGPAANLATKRKESDVGAPVGKVKATIEAGAFTNYEVSKSFYLHAEVLKGIGGHKGVGRAPSAPIMFGATATNMSSRSDRGCCSPIARYQRAYFGVTPEAALASGLPAYRPSGGIHGVAMASGISYQFSDRLGLVRLWARGALGWRCRASLRSFASSAHATSCRAVSA